jgi:hypothetical protein
MSILSRALNCKYKETDYPKGAQVGGMLLAADVHLQVVHPEDCHFTQQAPKKVNNQILYYYYYYYFLCQLFTGSLACSLFINSKICKVPIRLIYVYCTKLHTIHIMF